MHWTKKHFVPVHSQPGEPTIGCDSTSGHDRRLLSGGWHAA
jgi:hypothetical protein